MADHAAIIAHIKGHPGLGVRELGRALGLSPSGMSLHLGRLVKAGKVERRRRGVQWTHYLPGVPTQPVELAPALAELLAHLRGRNLTQLELKAHFGAQGWPRSTTQHRLHRLVQARRVHRRVAGDRVTYSA